jgi:3-methyladenine DNA glycosylase Tag
MEVKMVDDGLDFETARDVLSLISKKLCKKDWNKWSPLQRVIAMKYAGAVHCHASDCIVRKKELRQPIYVKRLKEIK